MNAALRLGFRTLSAVSPELAARAAGRLWFRLPTPRVSEASRAFLATGHRFDVDVNGRRVAGYRWGGSGPAVVLVHGWGGFAGQFHAIAPALTAAGFQAVTFDAPSHGESAAGALGPRHSTLFEFADALRAISATTSDLAGIVAHSGGCAAVAWTLVSEPRLVLPRAVFVAPFARPLRYMELFRDTLGLSDRALDRFQRQTETEFGFRWPDLEVPDMAARMTPPPTLVVHDREDRETRWQDGADIAASWPGARLESTTGLGHNRILRDPAVIERITHFLAGP